MKVNLIIAVLLCALAAGAYLYKRETAPAPSALQLYWFIPDGLRSEPVTMKIYEWAQAGELPNIAWMMKNGSYGYSIPVFPGHTTSNTATLVTGTSPHVHGVTDIVMRAAGHPVQRPAYNGFSSLAKKVPSIWSTLEDLGYRVALLSVPGSTPPEISAGTVIRGRWGGWGVEFPAVIFASESERAKIEAEGPSPTAPGSQSPLTKFVKWKEVDGGREAVLENLGAGVLAYIYGERVRLSLDKDSVWADLGKGEWSDWLPLKLEGLDQPAQVKVRVIETGKNPRLRFVYDNLNDFVASPPAAAGPLRAAAGPMVDFPDNYPPQLVQDGGDKNVFLEESKMSLDWHRKAAAYFAGQGGVVIHDIYTPNQMLTARWWLPYVDPRSAKYGDVTEEERAKIWAEVKDMYRQVDAVLGEVIAKAGPKTFIVMSSDHGAVPLDKEVLVNNWLEKKGFLKFKKGSAEVDWANTRAVFMQMTQVFVSGKGFAGNYGRGSGEEGRKLLEEVRAALAELKTPEGASPFAEILTDQTDRGGDLTLSFHGGYSGIERVTADREVFKSTLKGGYKQGVPSDENGMLTPFMIVGPGVKKDFALGAKLHHQDQYPTIFELMGLKSPDFVEGKVARELFSGK